MKALMQANEFAKMVNELRDLAVEYHAHQSLRGRIATIVDKYVQPCSKAQLTRAVQQELIPEGSHSVKAYGGLYDQ